MQTIVTLLIDANDSVKKLLEHDLSNTELMKFDVKLASPKAARETIEKSGTDVDVIMFGEKVPPSVVVDLTTFIRASDLKIPVLMLTKQSEARMPRTFEKAGVDEMLNI